jgi:predicted TIM-barrel fold metal-dependent hydrolase
MEVPMAIFNGVPQSDSGIPVASEQYPNRFISLYGGEAITLLDTVANKGSYTQAEETRVTTLIEDAMKTGKYRGFGEIALKHAALTNEKAGIVPVVVPGDHPWMFIMSDIAAEYNVPIDIHMDVDTVNEGIAGLEKLLDHNTKTNIIWSHTAWSRNNYDTSVSVQTMRQLLEKHPNLYSSLKIQPKETAFLDETGKIKPEWMQLFKDYPDRFMIGSDIKPGQFDDEFSYIIRHRKFLEQLPPEILKPIERDNAKKLFKIS